MLFAESVSDQIGFWVGYLIGLMFFVAVAAGVFYAMFGRILILLGTIVIRRIRGEKEILGPSTRRYLLSIEDESQYSIQSVRVYVDGSVAAVGDEYRTNSPDAVVARLDGIVAPGPQKQERMHVQ